MRLMKILRDEYKKIINIQTDGLLSQADKITLKNNKNKPPSYHKKINYKKWVCTDCKHELFYMVRSCPICESVGIVENLISTGIYIK